MAFAVNPSRFYSMSYQFTNGVTSGYRCLWSLDYLWCWSMCESPQMHSFPSQSFFTGRANMDVRCTFFFKNINSVDVYWKSLKWRVPKCAFLINRYLTIVNIMYAHRLLNVVDLTNPHILLSLTLLSKMRGSDTWTISWHHLKDIWEIHFPSLWVIESLFSESTRSYGQLI